jgi:2-keto-4-pentenoate hydratase
MASPEDAFNPRPAATILARAWRSGVRLDSLPVAIRPKTLAEGYDLQDAVVGEIGARAEGWKLGVGSRSGMLAAKIDRPLVGRVMAPRVYRNGDTVPLPNAGPATIELEIAFVLGRDIAPTDMLTDSLSAVERMHVTFELVLSRFFDRRAVGWPSFVGDLGGFGALVVGDPITDIEGVTKTVAVSVDGREVARGMTGDDLTYPVVAFGYLVAHARDRGITLRRGEIATLGAIGRPFDLAADADVVARYLGSQLRFRLQLPKESP